MPCWLLVQLLALRSSAAAATEPSAAPEAHGGASPTGPAKPSKASETWPQRSPLSTITSQATAMAARMAPTVRTAPTQHPLTSPAASSSPTDQPTTEPVDPTGHDGTWAGHDGPDGNHPSSPPGSRSQRPRGGGPPGPGEPGGPPPLVDTADVPVGGGVVLTSSRVVVTQATAGTFRCFTNRCTHMGCAVDSVTDGTIHCPCHGSLFAIDTGSPVAGPAPTATVEGADHREGGCGVPRLTVDRPKCLL